MRLILDAEASGIALDVAPQAIELLESEPAFEKAPGTIMAVSTSYHPESYLLGLMYLKLRQSIWFIRLSRKLPVSNHES
jgi:hypothetical protein